VWCAGAMSLPPHRIYLGRRSHASAGSRSLLQAIRRRGMINAMFALTHGELAIVTFLFALVWGAGLLPRLGERIAARLARDPAASAAKPTRAERGRG
jgi:hypothetical protein